MWRDELSWSCTAVAPPAVRIRSATTERSSGFCGRLMQSQPCWRSQVATAAAAIGARCCSSSFTTSFREPRSRRCLTRRNRSGARPGARPARNATGGWQGCRVRRTQQRCGVGGGLQPLASWSPLVRLPAGSWSADAVSLPQQNAAAGGTWVQLPRQHGICSVPLRREPGLTSCAAEPRQAVVITSLGAGAWRVGNGLIELDVSSAGLLALRDRDGRDQLSSSLQLERYRDRGEFWDAWDLAADYRSQPLGVLCTDSLEWLDQGPLVAHLVLRRQLGASCMRLDLRLKADTPWLELICGIDWRQTHELLRLELPLATPAVRIAADTSGGVIERPAAPMTAREQARWEVPVISWFASQSAAPGGGMAVLLDGPQGVDWSSDRLGISLLRGPTWPDPSADQGWHRQRLALMPFAGSWSDAGVSQAAIAFREPGWCADLPAEQRQWFPSLPFPLTPVGLERHADGCVLKLLNSGSARCRWTPGAGWRVRREADSMAASAVVITPGELVSLVVDQSS